MSKHYNLYLTDSWLLLPADRYLQENTVHMSMCYHNAIIFQTEYFFLWQIAEKSLFPLTKNRDILQPPGYNPLILPDPRSGSAHQSAIPAAGHASDFLSCPCVSLTTKIFILHSHFLSESLSSFPGLFLCGLLHSSVLPIVQLLYSRIPVHKR